MRLLRMTQGVDAKFDLTLELLEDGQGGLLGGNCCTCLVAFELHAGSETSHPACRPHGVLLSTV